MPVKEIKFNGLKGVELITSKLKITAVTEFGPRIAFFGRPDGKNLLLWEPEKRARKEWHLRGGHRVWLTRPGADESEETYSPDNDPAELKITKNGFRATGAIDPHNLTQRGFEVTILEDNKLKIDNFVINTGEMLYSAGVWALTCTVPGPRTQYIIPAGNGTKWDYFKMVLFTAWAGHKGIINDPQIILQDDLVLINPKGNKNKRMLQTYQGIIAMNDPDNKTIFAIKTGFDPELKYPMDCNLAFFIGPENFMVEMETMGPEITLKPGGSAHNIETWVLNSSVNDPADVKTLF